MKQDVLLVHIISNLTNSEDSCVNLAQANDLTGDSMFWKVKCSTPSHGSVPKRYISSPTNNQSVFISFLLHSVFHKGFIKYTAALSHMFPRKSSKLKYGSKFLDGSECN